MLIVVKRIGIIGFMLIIELLLPSLVQVEKEVGYEIMRSFVRSVVLVSNEMVGKRISLIRRVMVVLFRFIDVFEGWVLAGTMAAINF